MLKLGGSEHVDLMLKLKEYEIDAKSPLSSLTDDIVARCTDGRADFRRLFILFSLSSFLTPTSNRFVVLTTLPSLSDVDKISNYNWCTFILKKLFTAVQKYKSALTRNMSVDLFCCYNFVLPQAAMARDC